MKQRKWQPEVELEAQPFQDIFVGGCGGDVLTIGILPHLEFYLLEKQVVALRQLMLEASKKGATYDEMHAGLDDVRVERLKNSNQIVFGGMVTIQNLTDEQWCGLYHAIVLWQKALLESHGNLEEFYARIPADVDAYAIFQEGAKGEAVMKKQLADTFADDASVDLTKPPAFIIAQFPDELWT